MSCCGKGARMRPPVARSSSSARVATAPAVPAPAPARPAPTGVEYAYIGGTALTVIGPATGARYRFDRPGAVVVVDPRDAAALSTVPSLRASRPR